MSKDSPFYGLDLGVRTGPDPLEEAKNREIRNLFVGGWQFDPKWCYVDLLKAVMGERGYDKHDVSKLTNVPIEVVRCVLKDPSELTARIATRMAINDTLKYLAEIISEKEEKSND